MRESIIYRPYDPYLSIKSGPFPSGSAIDILSYDISMKHWIKPNIALLGEIGLKKSKNINDRFSVSIGINFYNPFM